MIFIAGKLFEITQNEVTDKKTGAIDQVYKAEMLHKSRGKNEITPVKLPPEMVEQWRKFLSQDITFEVAFYAMRQAEGVSSGLMLADKKSLPVIQNRKPVPT